MRIQDLSYKDVVHCDTKEKAIIFCKMMDHLGLRWSDGEEYTEENNWKKYKEQTCYHVRLGQYGSVDWFKNHKNIIPFEQIETKEFPLDLLGPENTFTPGVYWHFLGSFVEVRYIDSKKTMDGLGGTFELIQACEKPAPKLVKWTPSLEVPKLFWTLKDNKYFRYQGDRVFSNSRGVFVSSGLLVFESDKVYVENS